MLNPRKKEKMVVTNIYCVPTTQQKPFFRRMDAII